MDHISEDADALFGGERVDERWTSRWSKPARVHHEPMMGATQPGSEGSEFDRKRFERAQQRTQLDAD
ncbi:hypothetical protein CspHIS471_0607820 [Cutaneotrichosporon sp. HIS471]|nr:hypothetical protein CspHIS471_0607820 [Cutaneotrichosporon sp. HIS471]